LGRYRMLRCPALLAPVVLVPFSSGTLAELISKAAEPAGSTPDGFCAGADAEQVGVRQLAYRGLALQPILALKI
jgi:hypothetical protein